MEMRACAVLWLEFAANASCFVAIPIWQTGDFHSLITPKPFQQKNKKCTTLRSFACPLQQNVQRLMAKYQLPLMHCAKQWVIEEPPPLPQTSTLTIYRQDCKMRGGSHVMQRSATARNQVPELKSVQSG